MVLISTAGPLTVWIYRKSYLRFSSQLYTLRRFNEAIHLTNNSIQVNYKNCKRHPDLPVCNMWTCQQFDRFLASMGYPNVYEDVIYPEMKHALTAIVLMNQQFLHTRKNCFELYGADFLITGDFKPWLIEVNSRPAIHASTPITSQLCPQVLDDIIKVIIDYPRKPNMSTGEFEILHRGEVPQTLKNSATLKLHLEGKPLPVYYFNELAESNKSSTNLCELEQSGVKEAIIEMGKTLRNLLEMLQHNINQKGLPNCHEKFTQTLNKNLYNEIMLKAKRENAKHQKVILE